MSSAVISLLTVIAMLWHSVGGCCWHHDHQHADQEMPGSSVMPDVVEHACCHHQAQHQDESPDSGTDQDSIPDDERDHCGELSCAYVKSSSPDVVDISLPFPAEAVAENQEWNPAIVGTDAGLDRQVLWREHLSPLSQCALLQSWQI